MIKCQLVVISEITFGDIYMSSISTCFRTHTNVAFHTNVFSLVIP
jgi:hypothetical protein